MNSTPRQKILMCAPDYFGVDYVINPWMENQRGKTDPIRAREQWQILHDALVAEADIALIPPHPALPDLVFTANAGFVCGDKAIASRFRSVERQGEEPLFRAWFKDNGFALAPWPKNVFFEGAGDALFDRSQPIIWCAHGFRSDAQAEHLLEKLCGRRVVELRLVDPRFYHLDTCLCPLAGGWLMYYPEAFDDESQRAIAALVPPQKRIVVPEQDALQFACNAVDLNGRVFMNDASPILHAMLNNAGFTPVLIPLSEFLKAGGAAKCLTLKLVEP